VGQDIIIDTAFIAQTNRSLMLDGQRVEK